MTDTITDELLSPNERAPKFDPPERPALRETPQLATVVCAHCGKDYAGPMRSARLGRHIKTEHPEHWKGAVGKHGGKKPAAKKATATVTKVAPGRSPTAAPVVKRRPAGDALARVAMRLGKVAQAVEEPFGNALVFSAPAIGVAMDDAVKDTFIDKRIVQPLTKVSDRWEALSSAIGLPAMVLVVSKNPKLFYALEDELREAVEDVLIAQVPIIEKRVAKRKKVTEALVRLGELDPAIAADPDPIGSILRGFFPAAAEEPDVDEVL